ncbi:hypothetical protein [Hymenobacter sp. 5414T-23]|uniref:hypothetical protein n=1 Tax=Hymenobacter sp. 5414T-23 TaxID=2932252 RepID=UPI001FD121E5|nr:hypothetical protein [Hymenobacter sp. 5414T-23]UOQ80989.1 hypothetical protein MUN83_19610 [Hymenobacter sp. 5414T-23]
MNYVQHTRTAHEYLCARPEVRPHHVSLYWALFFAWNAARFPAELPLNRPHLMQAAHIGNRGTYLDTLRDLEAWGLLAYQPSHAGGSSVRMQVLGEVVPEASQPERAGCPTSGTAKPRQVVAEVGQPLYQKWPNPEGEVVPEVDQLSLYDKTGSSVNWINGATASQRKIEVLEREGHSGAELFDDKTQPEGSGANGAGPAQASPHKKAPHISHPEGTQTDAIRSAATAPRAATARSRALPDLPFNQSPIAQVENFIAAFQGTDYQLADLRHYHQLVATWRDKKTGLEPTRKDWVATAKRFMLNDAADNRLKLAPAHRPQQPGPADTDPGAFFARTGFRSKYDT